MKYASIVFDDERNLRRTALVEDIKFQRSDKTCIKPNTDTDFMQGHKYYVKYYYCNETGDTCHNKNHEHDFSYNGAYIFELGDSIEELIQKEKTEARRKFPNKKYMDTSSSTLSESNSHKKELKKINKKAQKQVRAKRLETIIKQVKARNKNLYEYFEDTSSESNNDKSPPRKQKKQDTSSESENDKSPPRKQKKQDTGSESENDKSPPRKQKKQSTENELLHAYTHTDHTESNMHPLLSCTEAAQTPTNASLQLYQSTNIPTFDGEANANGNYTATTKSNPNNAFHVHQSTTRPTGSQTVHGVHEQYDGNIDDATVSESRRSAFNEQPQNTVTISQTSVVENNDEAANESHVSGRRRNRFNGQPHNAETIRQSFSATVSGSRRSVFNEQPQNTVTISQTSAVENNDEAANESHFSGRRRNRFNGQPHNAETISQSSDVENNEEAANESHFHCKEWIDKLIEETITYYMKGNGKEEYRKRYTIENGKTYLGLEISMEPIRWNLLHCEKNPIKFVRMLALQIWGSETLINRAVVLNKVINKNRIPGQSPVKELERNKLKLLISIFADYLQSKGKRFNVDEQVEHLRKTTSYLSKKINEMKNALKKTRNHRVALNFH